MRTPKIVYDANDRITRNRRTRMAYKSVFGSPEGQLVLQDLYRFCRISDPFRRPEDEMHLAILEGARGVFYRIFNKIHANEERLQAQEELERRGNE